MHTEPDPSPQSSAGSAVGLAFVAVVLVSLFVAGSLGVVATRRTAPAADGGQPPDAATADLRVRDQVATRFSELMLLREIALRERDPRLLESVYAPGAAALARDRAEIARLRSTGRRLDGLRMPVKVFDAYRHGNGSWVVVARVGRTSARLVTGSGRQVRATRATATLYHATLIKQNGSWQVLRLARS
jgi:hypothetical protein